MNCDKLVLLVILSTLVARPAHAQRNTTVQLPSFRTFSTTTSVLVPDRGSVYAGGVSRGYSSSSRRGTPLLPGGSRAISHGGSTSGVRIHAHIHDMAEMDEAVLQRWDEMKGAARSRNASNATTTVGPRSIAWQQSENGISSAQLTAMQQQHALPKVSTVRKQLAAQAAEEALANAKRAERDFLSGRRLEQKGKLDAARLVYGNALKRAEGELKQQVAMRLATLNQSDTVRSKN